jgi:hypothetical protein
MGRTFVPLFVSIPMADGGLLAPSVGGTEQFYRSSVPVFRTTMENLAVAVNIGAIRFDRSGVSFTPAPLRLQLKKALSAIRNAVTRPRSIVTVTLTVIILRHSARRYGRPHLWKDAEYLYRALAGASSFS